MRSHPLPGRTGVPGRGAAVLALLVAVATAVVLVPAATVGAQGPTSTSSTSTSTSAPSTTTTVRPTTTTVRPTTTTVRPPTTTVRPSPPTTRPRPSFPPPPRSFVVFVSLGRQQAYVTFAGRVVRQIPISSGAGGRTPAGRFRVESKSRATVANSDRRVSMSYMTRFNGGIGFHGIPRKNGRALSTPLGRRAVSHGCIRMADANAKFIYEWVPRGSLVLVGR